MQLGMIGLGRMGGNMVRRLMKAGHTCIVYDRDPKNTEKLVAEDAAGAKTLAPGRGDIPRTPGRDKMKGTAEDGYLYCGPAGAGHFVKMIHNGIEYGMMQAYGEGFDILRNANSQKLPEDMRFDLPLGDIAKLWRRGSVVTSLLLELTATALAEDPALAGYSGYVEDSGEGRC